jgi:hypothetical protein
MIIDLDIIMAKKKSKSKSQKPIPQNEDDSDPWQAVFDIIKNIPWWIIKFVDWVFTVITAFLVYLVSY